MLDSWVHASKVVDVLLPLGRKQHSYVQGHMLCLHYTLCLLNAVICCSQLHTQWVLGLIPR
jgi:hypothetical protein